jgi:hypothetical protein
MALSHEKIKVLKCIFKYKDMKAYYKCLKALKETSWGNVIDNLWIYELYFEVFFRCGAVSHKIFRVYPDLEFNWQDFIRAYKFKRFDDYLETYGYVKFKKAVK